MNTRDARKRVKANNKSSGSPRRGNLQGDRTTRVMKFFFCSLLAILKGGKKKEEEIRVHTHTYTQGRAKGWPPDNFNERTAYASATAVTTDTARLRFAIVYVAVYTVFEKFLRCAQKRSICIATKAAKATHEVKDALALFSRGIFINISYFER